LPFSFLFLFRSIPLYSIFIFVQGQVNSVYYNKIPPIHCFFLFLSFSGFLHEVFAKLIGIDTVKIGEAVYEESNQLKDIWSDAIVLAYVAPRSTERKGTVYEPSYGYTVRRQGGLFVDTYKENGGKLEVIRTTDIHKPHLLGASAGYLIKGCL